MLSLSFQSFTDQIILMKEIYIVRHGQTDYNLQGIVQGSGIDADLNDTGRSQAADFFAAYGHIPFDKVYVSMLKRTRQSVQAFIDKDLPLEQHKAFDEICWGEREGTKFSIEEEGYYRWLTGSWQNGDIHIAIKDGESPEDVAKRQKPGIAFLTDRPEEQKVLVCMHGRAMRILLCQLTNRPLTEMDTFPHHNLGLYKLTYHKGTFHIEVRNDIDHLKALV